MKVCLFIQTNHKQIVGARVAEYAARRFSEHEDKFDVRIMHADEFPWLRERDGQKYLREGEWRIWRHDDLQSFTPTRFLPPALMGYEGRAVVIDPDIFFIADIWELFTRDMQGKAILARKRAGWKGRKGMWASSVMVLDNAKLAHWDAPRMFAELFEGRRDYARWITLMDEDQSIIGLLENEWNDFDTLTSATKGLHTTRRRTQPWKTGLPVDFIPNDRLLGLAIMKPFMKLRRKLFGDYGLLGRYKPHPDPNQEMLFFALLKGAMDEGLVTEALLEREMAQNHVRHDAKEVLRRTPPLDEVMEIIRRVPPPAPTPEQAVA